MFHFFEPFKVLPRRRDGFFPTTTSPRPPQFVRTSVQLFLWWSSMVVITNSKPSSRHACLLAPRSSLSSSQPVGLAAAGTWRPEWIKFYYSLLEYKNNFNKSCSMIITSYHANGICVRFAAAAVAATTTRHCGEEVPVKKPFQYRLLYYVNPTRDTTIHLLVCWLVRPTVAEWLHFWYH